MGASSLKRLRVRLKATDPDSLAEMFGSNVSENGLFLKSSQLLPVGTPVLLELCYRSGDLALRGRGSVESITPGGSERGMQLQLEWAEESEILARWIIERTTTETIDPYEEVTVLAPEALLDVESTTREEVDDAAEQPTSPGLPKPTPPPPPVPPPDIAAQPSGSNDAWDLVSDLLAPPPAPAKPRTDTDDVRAAMEDAFADEPSLETWGDTLHSGTEKEKREPGEVTPLARIELVRSPVSDPIRTGDIPPLSIDDDSGPIPLPSETGARMAPPSRRIMGIDFGTVNTRAAVSSRDRSPKIIQSRRGSDATPSVVMIRDTGKTIIGEPALRKLSFHPGDAILEGRRLLGLPFASERVQALSRSLWCQLVSGEDGEAAVRMGPYDISMEEIAALLLKEVRECALMSLEERINRAVLTCPPAFGVRQREALRVAARLGGVYPERLISEPVAAAIHAQEEHPSGGRTFVYRFGGGTFDATIVESKGDRHCVLASEGDMFLGGIDLDRAAAVLIAEEVARTTRLASKSDPSSMAIMLEAARKAKLALSQKERTAIIIESPAGDDASFKIEIDLARQQLESAWAPLIDRTIEIAKRALDSAGLTARDIDRVVLAGGQTRAPLVKQRVRELLKNVPLEIDPERCAVLGAASLADRMREIEVTELLGTSLFVAEFDAPPVQLIAQRTELPASAVHSVRASPKKSGAELMLCEGSDERTADAIGILRVGPFAGTAELRFEVSDEGLLSVSAIESGTRRPIRAEVAADLGRPNVGAGSPDQAKNGRSSLEK